MKKQSIWGGMCAVVFAMAIAANGIAQQSTPPPATDYTPAAPGATSSSPTTQVGTAPATSVETSPGIPLPASAQNGGQPRAIAAPAPSPGAFPAPTGRPGYSGNERADIDQSSGDQRAVIGQRSNGQGVGQRGELGVWLVESGGPGVEIRRITSGSAADQAGLQSGDVILQINGRGASSPHGVARMIREMPAGQTAVVQYWRDGQTSELEIALQATRAQYDVGFRGEDSLSEMAGATRTGSDLESRTMRLEEQLTMVMQELRLLRQEMTQMHTSAGSQPTVGGGFGEASTEPGFDGASQPTTSTTTTEPGAARTQPDTTQPADAATPGTPFGDSTTEPTAEPSAEPASEPAEAPATEPADENDDLFGGSTTEEPAATEAEPAAAEATPAEDEAATEEAPAAEAESDDLFE